jgi:hypothetical protein
MCNFQKRDSGYIKFVRYNIKAMHYYHICNCLHANYMLLHARFVGVFISVLNLSCAAVRVLVIVVKREV